MFFCILHRTRFWYKRRGFAVINIDIISYFVVKKHDTSFQTLLGLPCRVAVPLSWKCKRSDCECGPNVVPTRRWGSVDQVWGPGRRIVQTLW